MDVLTFIDVREEGGMKKLLTKFSGGFRHFGE